MGFTVDEGRTYPVNVEVRNQTTRAGEPVEATLGVGIAASLETIPMDLIPAQVIPYTFGPNEPKVFTFDLLIPVGTAGQSGTIKVWVEVRGAELASELTELTVSGVHAMPPFPDEPPLPAPGVGLPTEEEIKAVKATVRYRLDNLWWDLCAAVHYTDEMNEASGLALQPLWDLEERFTVEINQIFNQCLAQSNYVELQMELEALNDIQAQIMNAYILANQTHYVHSDGFLYDRATGEIRGHITDVMSAELKEAYFMYNCTPLPLHNQVSCPLLLSQIQALVASIQQVNGACQTLQAPMVRQKAELYFGFWYCGFPLGF